MVLVNALLSNFYGTTLTIVVVFSLLYFPTLVTSDTIPSNLTFPFGESNPGSNCSGNCDNHSATPTSALLTVGDNGSSHGGNCMELDGTEETYIITNVMEGYNKQTLPDKKGVTVEVEMTINDITSLSDVESEFVLDLFFSEIWKDPALNYSSLPGTCLSVTVEVEMTINDITSLSDVESEFVLDLFFSEIWKDPALNYSSLPGTCLSNVTLSLEFLSQIWQPNICIVNSRFAEIHNSPSQNVFLILYADGRVWRNCRMKVVAPCTINLKKFPFDEQPCTVVMESYSFNSQKVRLQWYPTAVSFVGPVELPDFLLLTHSIEHQTIPYPNGRWDQLKITFIFQRRYGFFILQAYVPTYMTIFVAWINFWMDPAELATRATLSISAFLAMTLQFGNILKNQPRVSYIKAIDVWMLGGISFLFVTLAELAVISYMVRTDRPDAKFKRPGSRARSIVLKSTAEMEYMKAQKKRSSARGRSPLAHFCPPASQDYETEETALSVISNGPSPSANTHYLFEPRVVNDEGMNHRSLQTLSTFPELATPTPRVKVFVERLSRHRKTRKILREFWADLTPYAIDKFFLIAYPPAFVIFNCFYWIYYLHMY